MTCNPCDLDRLDNGCPCPMDCPLMFEPDELPGGGPREPMPTEQQVADWGDGIAFVDNLIAKQGGRVPVRHPIDDDIEQPEAWAGFSDPVNDAAARNRQRWATLAEKARKRAGRE